MYRGVDSRALLAKARVEACAALRLRKEQEMEQDSSRGDNSHKSMGYAGSGLAIGMIFGLMLFENLPLGCAIGAALGLIIGARIDATNRR
jgi:hypothetical protein